MNELKIVNFDDLIGSEFLCANCGYEYTHQQKVEVFDRQEDSPTGSHVIVDNCGVSWDDNMTGNPSPRRDGIKIWVDCEDCKKKTVIIIQQHKGKTYISATPEGLL